MNEFFRTSLTAGVVLSLVTYMIGLAIKNKFKIEVLNPLIISVALISILFAVFQVDYDTYNLSAKYLSYLLTPATVSFAIPLYKQIETLRKNAAVIFVAILAGTLANCVSVFLLARLFKMSAAEYATVLPKSITTAIGVAVAEEIGGYPSITAVLIAVTGVFGNITAQAVCKMFRIKNKMSQGLAIGTAAHVLGTSRAMEMGEVEGAMSSLAIVVSGILTVIIAPLAMR